MPAAAQRFAAGFGLPLPAAHRRRHRCCRPPPRAPPAAVKKLLEENQLPHLLFYGPPGTGKTSTILAIARQMYGSSLGNMTLELNASGGWVGRLSCADGQGGWRALREALCVAHDGTPLNLLLLRRHAQPGIFLLRLSQRWLAAAHPRLPPGHPYLPHPALPCPACRRPRHRCCAQRDPGLCQHPHHLQQQVQAHHPGRVRRNDQGRAVCAAARWAGRQAGGLAGWLGWVGGWVGGWLGVCGVGGWGWGGGGGLCFLAGQPAADVPIASCAACRPVALPAPLR